MDRSEDERGPDQVGPVPSRAAETVLAEATNLRAARLTEALELARTRRLELATARAERDAAIRERDEARARLERVRSLPIVRLARRAVRSARAVGRYRRDATVVPNTFRSGGDRRTTERQPGDLRRARAGDPAVYRATLLSRLHAASGASDPIRAVIDDAAPGGGSLAEALRELGWHVSRWGATSDAPQGVDSPGPRMVASKERPDVALFTLPTSDPRTLPRRVPTVAVVSGATEAWTAAPWFDAFDIVLVRERGAADAVGGVSAKTATVVAADGEQWPPPGDIRDAVVAWASAVRVAIMVQAPNWDAAEQSGDFHVARGLQRQFERRGHPTSIYFRREWTQSATSREDIVIHIWGRYEMDVRPTQVNAIWIMYHPELVTQDLVRRYDRVFAGSDRLAARLAAQFRIEVASLHQATDAERFRPTPGGPRHQLLFVGNSRGTRRTTIDAVSPTPHELAVYGGGWDPELVDPAYVRGTVVPNRELPSYYGGAAIVLNDHWVESQSDGLINNRVYDALAAGAFVISDDVPGLHEEFDDGVVTFHDPADLALKVERYLGQPELRQAHVERGRAAVLSRHTFGHRADTLLASLLPLATGGSVPRRSEQFGPRRDS